MSTISGFSKMEIYKQLDKLLLESHLNKLDKTKLEIGISLSLELVCTKNEIPKFIRYYINFLSQYIVHTNNNYNYFILFYKSCKTLLHYNDIKNRKFQKAFSHFITLLFFAKKKVYYFEKRKNFDIIDSFICNISIYTKYHPYFVLGNLDQNLTSYTKHIICILLYSIKHSNYELFNNIFYDIFISNSFKDEIQILPFNWKKLDMLHDHNNYKDIFWVIWKIILLFKDDRCKDNSKKHLIDILFEMTLIEYKTNKDKKERLIFLQKSFELLMNNNQLDYSVKFMNDDIMKKIDENICNLFNSNTSKQNEHLSYLDYIPSV